MKDLKSLTRNEEFSIICEDYLFPLVGVPFGGAQKIQFEHDAEHYVELRGNGEIFVYDSLKVDSCYAVQVSKHFPPDLIKLLDLSMKNLNEVRRFNPNKKVKVNSLPHLRNEFSYAIQKTVCDWITDGNEKAGNIAFKIK